MDNFLDLLSELVPVAVAFIAITFGYLVYLFKQVGKEFIQASKEQSEYLKDRVDVVDKSSQIFTRTIEQQEKEIKELHRKLGLLSSGLDDARNTVANRSITEISSLAQVIENVAKMSDIKWKLLQSKSQEAPPQEVINQLAALKKELSDALEHGIPRLIESRDLSRYAIDVVNILGADDLVAELSQVGFQASVYEEPWIEHENVLNMPEEQQAIWLGKEVPAKVAVYAITIARKHFKLLSYVHISGDGDDRSPDEVHSQLFFGGTTKTANDYSLIQWSPQEFESLRDDMSQEEFHECIGAHYG